MHSEAFRANAAVVAVLFVGVILRTVQYGSLVSMSSDEIAIALNVIDRGWMELLFRPLMHDQVAPLGFLFHEKAMVAIFGDNEAAFRFVPYLLSLVSLALFWRLSSRYLETPSMLAALIVFALSPSLVLYSGVAKQYPGDIAVTLLLLLMVLRFFEGPATNSEATVVGVIGGLSLLLSQPAVLVATGLGAALLIVGWRDGKPVRQLVAICAGWSAGAAIATYVSLSNLSSSTSTYMERFWQHDFVPQPWTGLAELFWIPTRLAESMSYLAAYINSPGGLFEIGLSGIYGLLLLLGVLHLFQKNRRTTVFLIVPVVAAILASVFRLLPLSGRVSLFMAPSLLIGCFAAVDRIRIWVQSRRTYLVTGAALVFAALPGLRLLALSPPPTVLGGTRPVLQAVKAHWLPGDKLVVSKGRWARISTEYYGRRLGLEVSGHIERSREANGAEEVLRGYLLGIDHFRGARRTWFYLEEIVDCEEEAMLGYLMAIGKRQHSVEFRINKVNKVSAHLFDLSDPTRLRRADARSYPIPECKT